MNERERPREHPADEELLAWLDGELPPGSGEAIERHVQSCPACALAVRDVEDDAAAVGAALRAEQRPPTPDAYDRILRRHTWRRVRRASLAAAVLAGILVGGAAALMPGSPLRSWLTSLADSDPPAAERSAPSEQPVPSPHLSVAAPASVDVAIASPADSLRIRVSLSAEPWLEVRTGPGDRLDRIELDEGRLIVEPGSARSIGITLPARSRLRILVGGDVLLAREPARPDAGATWMDTTFLLLPRQRGGGR